MTKIKDIVSINDRAVLNNAIQLSWYDDAAQKMENDRLVGGYVFGNAAPLRIGSRTFVSSLPIFEKIRDSFTNSQAGNIFTVIANYGHGKSHFALVLANYFGLAPDSPVVEDIINHLEICSDKPTADHFRHFKNPPSHFQDRTFKPQLVVTLAGHQFQDLRQGFLQALRRALDAHDRTRHRPIKSVSAKAVEWLNALSSENQTRADEYLAGKYQLDKDTLIAGLENYESDKEQIARDLSRELNGIEADFGAHVNLKQVVTDTVDELCAGADAPFSKMLILFDELGVYAQRWCHNPQAAGNFAPQEIFEACSDRRGKLTFVGFVQRELSEFVQGYNLEDEFKKWAGRMLPESTFWLVSNLEEVISKLIVKKDKWHSFIQDNSPRITDESNMAWESIQRYKDSWDANRFYQTVSRDCFPLHPLTTGLLCGFNFTQGSRTIISAINSMMTAAEEQEVNSNGKLKWIRPIELVKEFEIDFKNDSPNYSDYEYALKTLSQDDEPIYADLLQALFLFKEGQLKKPRQYDHDQILAKLAGYPEAEIRAALKDLTEDRDAIRYSQQKREYEFTGVGTNRGEVLKIAQREVAGKRLDSLVGMLGKLREFENLNLDYKSIASDFKTDFYVESDEWYLASHFMDAGKLDAENLKPVKDLCAETSNKGDARGTLIYLLSNNAAELEEARHNAERVLDKLREEKYPHALLFAVPNEAATQIEKQILIKNYLVHEMSSAKKAELGDSYRAALLKVSKDVNEQFIEHIRSVEYKIPSQLHLEIDVQRKTLDQLASILFTDVYHFRAPSNSVSMKPKKNTGNTATAEIALGLIVNELKFDGLNAEKQNIVKNVLKGTRSWEILDDRYKIQEPKNPMVAQAWNMLRKNISEDGWTSFASLLAELTAPPFGYDDLTATLLIAAWIGKHKYELGFKDSRKQNAGFMQKASEQSNLTIADFQNNLNRAKEFTKWLRSNVLNVSVQHSGRANKRRANDLLERMRAVKDIGEAKSLLEQVEPTLQTLAPKDELITQIEEQKEQLQEFIELNDELDNSLKKFQDFATRGNDIPSLLRQNDLLSKFGTENGVQSKASYVETLQLFSRRIEAEAKRQSQTMLVRIEGYDSVQAILENCRKALNQAGRADLENLFIAALNKVKNDYDKLKARETEQPFITEINAVQIGGMPLRFYTDGLRRIEEILAENPSERVASHAAAKQKQLDEQIKILRDFAEKISGRAADVKDVGVAEDLQREIHRRESLYQESPEADRIADTLQTLTTRISELKKAYRQAQEEKEKARQIEQEARKIEQKRRQEERETEQKRQMEMVLATNIADQFTRINDAEQRFEVLLKVFQHAQQAGLSDEQKSHLNGLLN